MSLLYSINDLKLKVYDTRSIVNRRQVLMDFNNIKTGYGQMNFQYDAQRKRFNLIREESNYEPQNPRPLFSLCDYSMTEANIKPHEQDILQLSIRRRMRSFHRGLGGMPKQQLIEADMHSVTCIHSSNLRGNIYRIAGEKRELSPGYMFLLSPPKQGISWVPSEMILEDVEDDGYEDTVAISYFRAGNHPY